MAIKAMLKSLDGLDATQRALYRKEGDGDKAVFVLDVEPVEGYALENVTGLKGALTKERERVEEATKRVEAFKDIDPAKAREALSQVEKMKSWTPEEKVQEQISAKLKDLAAQKDAEYAPKLQAYEATRKAYESMVIDRGLEEALAKHKFIAPKLAAKLMRDQVGIGDDGKPFVKGADGKPRVAVQNDGSQRLVTIEEFAAEQAKLDEFKPLIAGNPATGSTGAGGHNTGSQPNTNPAQPHTPHVSEEAALNKLADALAHRS